MKDKMSIVRMQNTYLKTIYFWEFILCKYDAEKDDIVHCNFICAVIIFILMQIKSYVCLISDETYSDLYTLSDQSNIFMVIICTEIIFGKLTLFLFQLIAIIKRNDHIRLMKRLHYLQWHTRKLSQADTKKLDRLRIISKTLYFIVIVSCVIMSAGFLSEAIALGLYWKLILIVNYTSEEGLKHLFIVFLINIIQYLNVYLVSIKSHFMENPNAQGRLFQYFQQHREICSLIREINKAFGYFWTITIGDTFLVVTSEIYYLYYFLQVANHTAYTYDDITVYVFGGIIWILLKILMLLLFIYVCDVTSREASEL